MKYIQDENTNTLIVYLIIGIVIIFLIAKWDIYESKKCEEEGEYRELISKIRLRSAIIYVLIGIYAVVMELSKR